MSDIGSLTIRIKPGESIHIGDDIIIVLPESQGGNKYSMPTRLKILAPKSLRVDRYTSDGINYRDISKDSE